MSKNPTVPDELGGPDSYEAELRRRALDSVERKQGFKRHLSAYVVVQGLLILIWAITSRGYFWPIWPMLGWGIGLVFQALSLRSADPGPQSTQVQAEVQRLRELDRRRGQAPQQQPPADPPPPQWPTAPGALGGPDGGPQDTR